MSFIESSAAPPNDLNKSIKLLPLSLLLAILFTIILIITILSTLIYRYVTRRQPEEINPEQESSSESKEDDILLNNNIIDVYNPEDTDLSSNSLVDCRELDNISIVTYRSYAPSNVDFEMEEQDDIAGFQQHKWKKLNATTAV